MYRGRFPRQSCRVTCGIGLLRLAEREWQQCYGKATTSRCMQCNLVDQLLLESRDSESRHTGNEEAQVAVAQHSSDTDQTRTSTRHNAHILPCALALAPLAVVLVVQCRDRLSQRPDTSSRTVLSAMSTDINLLRPLKAAFDAIIDLGRSLTKVCPFFRMFKETVLVCLF